MPEEPDIGPSEPIDGLLNLTDSQFIARYDPEFDAGGGYYRQREWYDDADKEVILKAIEENRCWTAVEDDDGIWCLVWGNRVVNRLYNVITRLPIEDTSWEIQVQDPIDRDDYEEGIPEHMRDMLDETDTSLDDWESIDGPETGVGVEFWYRHTDGREVYIMDDQGHITWVVSDPDEDEEELDAQQADQLKDEKRGLYPDKEDVAN